MPGRDRVQDGDWSVERSRIERQRQQGPRRQWQPLVVALVALLVIAGAVGSMGVYMGHWLSPAHGKLSTATPNPILPLLSIDTSQAQSCPTGVAWSPNGLELAVAVDGEESDCSASDPGRTRAVILYNARSGAQLKYFDVHEIYKHLNISVDNAFAEQPSWSPDGSMIVLPFLIEATQPSSVGLLVIPMGSGVPRALLYTTDMAESAHPIWDLKTGKLAALQTKALPPALTYTWGADGSIQPGEAIPPGSSTAYTGSPVTVAGGASLSRWQRGVIWPVARPYYSGPPVAWFHLDVGVLWSPDGRYVAPNYSIVTRLPEPGGRAPMQLLPQDFAPMCGDFTSVATANSYCGQASLPYPDVAYARVVAAARAGIQKKDSSGRTATIWNPVEVAWRPDGKVLATMLPVDDFASFPSQVRVTLYDTATGQTLTTLSQSVPLPSSQTNGPFYLSWSPTGRQLALVNNGDSRIIVWGSSSLASLPPIATR
ncbi:MAG: PD40 domain-containing protein [Chloroflexota bacterium]|nr:PD40 domain-containing protein [Chloroflexota bacterium]